MLTQEIIYKWWSESSQRKLQAYLLSAREIKLYSENPLLLYNLPATSTPIILRKMNSSIHECSVGLRLNTLRALIPNFVFTYGCFPHTDRLELKPPYNIDKVTGNDYVDTLLEYVPGSTLHSRMKNCHYKWILNIYLQVVSALEIAHQQYHFVHHDLDLNNIIIRDYDIPVIIDLEFATLLAGDDLFYIDTSYSNIGFDSPTIDPLSLLRNIMNELLMLGNHDCFDRLLPILYYFLQQSVPFDTIKYLDPPDLYPFVIPVHQFSYQALKNIIAETMRAP